MKKLLSIALILIGLTFLSCGGKGGTAGEVAKANQKSADDVAKELGKDFTCDGEGEEFTGKYQFHSTGMKITCALGGKEKSSSLPEAKPVYECVQKDIEFECKQLPDLTESLKGCIARDGKFKLTASGNNLFMLKNMEANSKDTSKAFYVGTINQSDGDLKYYFSINKNNKTFSCSAEGKLEVQQTNE